MPGLLIPIIFIMIVLCGVQYLPIIAKLLQVNDPVNLVACIFGVIVAGPVIWFLLQSFRKKRLLTIHVMRPEEIAIPGIVYRGKGVDRGKKFINFSYNDVDFCLTSTYLDSILPRHIVLEKIPSSPGKITYNPQGKYWYNFDYYVHSCELDIGTISIE